MHHNSRLQITFLGTFPYVLTTSGHSHSLTGFQKSLGIKKYLENDEVQKSLELTFLRKIKGNLSISRRVKDLFLRKMNNRQNNNSKWESDLCRSNRNEFPSPFMKARGGYSWDWYDPTDTFNFDSCYFSFAWTALEKWNSFEGVILVLLPETPAYFITNCTS